MQREVARMQMLEEEQRRIRRGRIAKVSGIDQDDVLDMKRLGRDLAEEAKEAKMIRIPFHKPVIKEEISTWIEDNSFNKSIKDLTNKRVK